MKYLFMTYITLSFFTALNVFSQDNWMKQNSPVSTVLLNCTFTDSLNGWAAGDSGVIIHTSDGGNNWFIQSTPVTYYINDIFFIDKNYGWVIANEFLLNGTTLLKTSNGGVNWIIDDFQDSLRFFRTIYFLDSITGFLGGFEGSIYKTTDSGNNWFPTSNDSSLFSYFPVAKFFFISDNLGFAVGGQIDIAGVIWKTTDSGLNWTADGFSPEPFYDITSNNGSSIFAVGGDFEYGTQISKSQNSGQNWVYENLGFFGQAQSISFRTQTEVWMPLGFAGTWAVSYDSGNNWISFPVLNDATLYSVDFPDSLHGWAVGSNGTILKYIPVKVGIVNQSENLTSNYTLFQNYPNPFNPVTKLKFSIPSALNGGRKSLISIKVFDVLGNYIATLVDEFKKEGSYEVEFNGHDLPSGIYFYSLIADGSLIDTKRMILLK